MLLRHGLQDFLIRGEFDYLPLARAVENAIERHRVLSAALSVQMTDPLTGLLSARAFSVMAERDLRWMAEAGGTRNPRGCGTRARDRRSRHTRIFKPALVSMRFRSADLPVDSGVFCDPGYRGSTPGCWRTVRQICVWERQRCTHGVRN